MSASEAEGHRFESCRARHNQAWPMLPPILTLRDISLTFGSHPLLENVNLSVTERDRLCVVGRNGCGKSTLIEIASGLVEADTGERFVKPGVTFRYLPQEPDLSGFETCLKYIEAGLAPGDDFYKVSQLLEQLGLKGDEKPNCLSVGEARRCALIRVLAPEPDILFLDEPTNHLDLSAIKWLESYLDNSKSALVLISHDRQFLEKLTRATLWIDRGEVRRLDRGFSAFEAWRDKALEQEEAENHKLKRKIHRENHWLIHGVTARRKRNQGRLRALKEMRKQSQEKRAAVGNVKMVASDSELSGKIVVEVEQVSKSFNESNIVKDFSTRIVRGDRVGIIGSNGVGKTTLLNLLNGTLCADSGTVHVGHTVQMVSLDQRRENLNLAETLSETLTGGHGDSVVFNGRPRHVISYMKDFLFKPEQAGTPIRELSGGERGRLMIAKALARPSNLLVLDEPTNDLDLETLDVLQEMLSEYHGTVLLVSHDRDFLDRVVTSLIVSNGDGRWVEYAGGYTDMLAQCGTDNQLNSNLILRPAKKRRSGNRNRQGSSSRLRLSYKDVYALEVLPQKITQMGAEIDKLKMELEVPDLYLTNSKKFQITADKLHQAEGRLAQLEEEWLALEIKREELEGF